MIKQGSLEFKKLRYTARSGEVEPPPGLGSKWGKWVDRLSDFGKYKGYIRNHSTSLPAYCTLSEVWGGSTSADLAVSLRTLVNVQAKSEQLWTWTARRDVVQTVLDSWVSEAREEATLEILLLALNYPDFKDVKMRVERMVHLAS